MKHRLPIFLAFLVSLPGFSRSASAQAVAVTLRLDTNVLGICRTTVLHVYAQVVPSIRTNSDRIFSWYVDVLNTNGAVASANYAALVKSASDNDSQTSSNGFNEGAHRRGIYDTFLNLPGAGVTNPVELLAIPILPLTLGQTRFRVQHGSGVPNLGDDFLVAPLGGGDPQTGGDYSGAFVDLTVVATSPTTATALTSVTNLCPGRSATFSTTASGTGPFTYRWTKAGATIGGATTNSYTIPSAASSDSGTFCVIVGGLCNSVTNCATLSVLSPLTVSCPANVTTNICGTSVAAGFASPTVTGGGLRGCVPASGSVFALGVNAVVCSATNMCATNTCSFDVTVAQIAAPIITCPPNVTTNICGTSVAVGFANPTVTGGGLRGCVPASGSAFTLGVHPVICSVTNACATNTCSFNVTVAQIAAATIACPPNATTNICGSNVVVSFVNPTVTGGGLRGCVPASGSAFAVGINAVICSVTNACATNTCSFNVTVAQIAAATIACPPNATTNTCGSNVVVSFVNPTVTGGALRGCVPVSGSAFALGVNAVICTVTNACATNTCAFNVTVVQIAVPPVAITLQGTNVVISWPAICSQHVLRSTPNLNVPITWQPVATTPIVVSNRYQVTLPHAAPQQFFRLFGAPGP